MNQGDLLCISIVLSSIIIGSQKINYLWVLWQGFQFSGRNAKEIGLKNIFQFKLNFPRNFLKIIRKSKTKLKDKKIELSPQIPHDAMQHVLIPPNLTLDSQFESLVLKCLFIKAFNEVQVQ